MFRFKAMAVVGCGTLALGANRVGELEIWDNCDQDNQIVGDGYDGWGIGTVNEDTFDWDLSEAEFIDGELVGREIIIPGE